MSNALSMMASRPAVATSIESRDSMKERHVLVIGMCILENLFLKLVIKVLVFDMLEEPLLDGCLMWPCNHFDNA